MTEEIKKIVRFVSRENGLITSDFAIPQREVETEEIEVESTEFIAYKEKTGKYEVVKTYVEKRLEEYGSTAEQLEYIVENGIEAFIAKQKAIKTKFPK